MGGGGGEQQGAQQMVISGWERALKGFHQSSCTSSGGRTQCLSFPGHLHVQLSLRGKEEKWVQHPTLGNFEHSYMVPNHKRKRKFLS